MKHIILTGGGTAGHVTPNLALIPALKAKGFDIRYIGSHNGIEKKLIRDAKIPYHGIASGKLRRYFDIKNLSDPFKVLKGYFEAAKLLKKYKPDVIFSKGGFVAVPVVFAAKKMNIPVIIHESDMTPGLANKLCIPSAKTICCNFPETMNHLPEGKTLLTGSPIRQELLEGSRLAGLKFTELSANKPILLIIGGSLGSVVINNAVRNALSVILKDFQVIHICGRGNLDQSMSHIPGYRQYEYVGGQLKDIFAAANLIVSRAGANAICEFLSLRKPNILIPLSAAASRGDQLLNAESFKKQGYSQVILEEELTEEFLINTIAETYKNRQSYIQTMGKSPVQSAVAIITDLIVKTCSSSDS